MRFTSFPAYAWLEFVRGGPDELIPYRIAITPKHTHGKDATAAWDQAERQVWRVAYWWLKSKLEAVAFGLVEFEEDFLPYMLLANEQGQPITVAHALFDRLAGRIALHDDPFGGLRPALPEGTEATNP